MQVNLRQPKYLYALVTPIVAIPSILLGLLACLILPILIIASIPVWLYLIFRTSSKIWNDSDYTKSTQPVLAQSPKVYRLIQLKRLTNYKLYHLN